MIVDWILKRKYVFFVFPLFIFALIFAFSSKVDATPGDYYATVGYNNTYTLVTTSSASTLNNINYCLGINGQKCALDSNAPLIKREYGNYYSSTPIASQRFYFEYMNVNTLQGARMYRIKSPMDMAGCLTINGNIETNATITYSKVSSSIESYQRWLLRKCVNGKYQIVPERNTDLAICYGETNVYLAKATSSFTYFELKSVTSGTYEVKTNIQKCTTAYNYNTSNIVERFLDPLTDGTGRISSMFTMGIDADNYNTYNGVKAYTLNPTKTTTFKIHLNRTFGNSSYSSDGDILYGTTPKDSNTKYTWKLNDDKTNYFCGSLYSHSYYVGKGMFLIELSSDNKTYNVYETNAYPSFDHEDTFSLNKDIISNGTYVRIAYVFQVINTKTNETMNIRETSEPFYLVYDGFGNDDLGVVKINYSNPNIATEFSDGAEMEIVKIASTLKNGAIVAGGFSIQEVINGYTIKVYLNGNSVAYSENKKYAAVGKYEITVTSKLGNSKNITIYNISSSTDATTVKKSLKELYFVDYFKDIYEIDNSFIKGNRILSGSSDYLEKENIKLPYSWVNVPLFTVGCSYRIASTTNLPPLTGTITRINNSDTETINITTSADLTSGRLNKSGYYTASLSTTNDTGYIVNFSFAWMVVDEEPGPVINELLIKTKSQEIYDLKPVYYAVNVECGSYKYEENGEEVEKKGVLTYAFSTYEKALDFALKNEKKYVVKTDEGYVYSHCNYAWAIDEYDLFGLMYDNAKNNVFKSFFSKENKIITNRISISDSNNKEDAYQISFNNDNNCMIVTNSIEEREALTERQPFINNYQFINVDIDSSRVKIVNEETNEEYEIEFGVEVYKQLENKNAPTGKYKVVEYNCHNIKNEYYVYYISEQFDSSIVVNAKKNNESITIDSNDNNTSISSNSFTISDVKCEYDDHCLIYIRHNNEYEVYDSYEFDVLTISEKGSYEIKFIDRLGRCILINLSIE
ncbi:MAG: hypothetical protein K6E24_03830 [bacterium]|nr:hypothetical protein [bacterium]